MAHPIHADLPDLPGPDPFGPGRIDAGAIQRDPPRLAGLSRILRGIGAAALVASASTFLLQHWDSAGDLTRYFTLVAHAALLSVVGFVWGLRAQDAKGARTFLGLAAGLVPAVFCALGGLVYSQLSWDGAGAPAAQYAVWVAPSAPAAAVAVGVTFALLVPVVALAFLALARPRFQALSAAYLVANASLLVPTRDPSVVAAIAGALMVGLVALELRVLRRETALRTFEGGLVRALILAPLVLLLVRSALHYELSLVYYAVVAAALAAATFGVSQVRRLPGGLQACLRGFALAPAGVSVALATGALSNAGLADGAVLPVASLGFAGIVTATSLLAGASAWGVRYRQVAAGVAVVGLALNLWLVPSAAASLLLGIASIATLSHGFLRERPPVVWLGAAGTLIAGAEHVRFATELYAWSRWGSLALLGVAVILGAWVVERHGSAIAARFAALRDRAGESLESGR